jgi:hypothetical protein
MSDSSQDNGRQGDDAPGSGILAALPRTRPQRASPRRAAAAKKREAAPKRASAKTARTPVAKTKTPVAKTKTPSAKAAVADTKAPVTKAKAPIARAKAVRKAVRPVEPSVPKQGYEPEDEIELGTTVDPPSSVELVESVADIFSELAGAGLTAGGRVLKDVFSLLRFP